MRQFTKNAIGARGVAALRGIKAAVQPFVKPIQKELVRRKLQRQRLSITDLSRLESGVTLFLAPEAGVTPHFVSHCVLARTLKELGHPTLMIGCFDLYPRCIVIDSTGAADVRKIDRDFACVRCGKNSASLPAAYGLDVFNIGEMIGPDERARIEDIVGGLPADISTFAFDGIPIGKICAGEAAVSLKILDFAGDTPQSRDIMIQYLRGMLLSYFAMQNLAKRVSISRIVYFSEYSMLLGAVFAGQKLGVPSLCMSHAHIFSNDRGRPTLSPESAPITYRRMLSDWPQWRELALPPARVDAILSDSIYRFAGNNTMVYSRARSGSTDQLYGALGLRPDRPVVVAFTSSQDEVVANQMLLKAFGGPPFPTDQPFADHMDWLTQLIDHAEASGSYQLVVRIHPREDANRRETGSSQHLQMLRARFDRDFQNVRMVWPRDKVSSYDLMEIADAGTSAWSSTVMEMARLGVPTIIAFRNYTPMPTGDVLAWSREAQGYFQFLEQAVASKPDLGRILAATRWMSLRLFGHSADISDVIPDPHCSTLPDYKIPASSKFIEDVLIGGKTPLELNYQMLAASQGGDAQRLEHAALLRNLRRIVWLFTFGHERPADYRLYYADAGQDHVPPDYDALAWSEDGLVTFRTHSECVTRHSRMIERLLPISSQNMA